MRYKVEKIINNVYNLSFEDPYDLSMFFLRYQEFYESPNLDFKGQQFQIIEYMEWYSKSNKGYFSYPIDFSGYNIPSNIIDQVQILGIQDGNKYDYEMMMVHRKLKEESGENYYLIGSCNGDIKTLDHEIAHSLFFTIPEYKEKITKLVESLDPEFYRSVCFWLSQNHYHSDVFVDETQAYLSTGFPSIPYFNSKWRKHSKPFKKLFKEYKNEAIRNTFKD